VKLAVFLLLLPVAAAAQERTALAELVARARAATERFRDPEVARAAGYRPVGPDFPSMGRHWVHPSLILREMPDPGAPPILEYAELSGRPTLVGVAYAALVRDGPPPFVLPVPADAWHFHQGTVEEESFLRSHAGVAHVGPGPKIAVLHAWIWLDNPDGLLATDNWALPYARLGFTAPVDGSRPAARAAALAAGDGGRAYVQALISAVGHPSPEEAAALASLVANHQTVARALLDRRTGATPPVIALDHCWAALWEDVRRAVRPEVWERLQVIH
jgi:hypothetical protein